jgi:hypothetical protein
VKHEGNLFGRFPLGDELKDLPLPAAETGQRTLGRGGLLQINVIVNEGFGNLLAQVAMAKINCFDCFDDLLSCRFLGDSRRPLL